MTNSTNQDQIVKVLVSQAPNEGNSGLTATLDVAAMISAVLWPLVVFAALWVYRDKLSTLIGGVLGKVKKIEFGGVSLEWAEVKELSDPWTVPGSNLDLRTSSNGLEVNESSMANILRQLDQQKDGDYVVVDLGTGTEWFSSRLFILAVLFNELRNLRALVFVDTKDEVTKRFVGWIEPGKLARCLGLRYPKLAAAYSAARLITDKSSTTVALPGGNNIMQMGLANSQAGSNLFRQFLYRVKPLNSQAVPPSDVSDWTPMPTNPGYSEFGGPLLIAQADEWVEYKGNRFYEYARWMNQNNLGTILDDQLHTAVVNRTEIRGKTEGRKVRAVLLEDGDFVAIVKGNNRFDRLVDRKALMEKTVDANLAES